MSDEGPWENHLTPAQRFENAFERLLGGERLNLCAPEMNLSRMFEIITANLMAEVPAGKYHWYDGVVGLTVSRRKVRQLEFRGEMWVGDVGNIRMQWKEEFRAIVTDKRTTRQGIWVMIVLGDDRAEGELQESFGD